MAWAYALWTAVVVHRQRCSPVPRGPLPRRLLPEVVRVALARAYAVGLVGLHGHVVEVEADLAAGLPGLTVIGLPDAALAEARDRVRAAIVNSGQPWPQRRITLALSPAAVPKRGSAFDLALAAAVLAAAGCLPVPWDTTCLGPAGSPPVAGWRRPLRRHRPGETIELAPRGPDMNALPHSPPPAQDAMARLPAIEALSVKAGSPGPLPAVSMTNLRASTTAGSLGFARTSSRTSRRFLCNSAE